VFLLEAPDELRRLLRDQPSLWLPGVGLVALLGTQAAHPRTRRKRNELNGG
jgi:hypothetical protein